jgi:curved DNA-binding protein CbpA
MDNTKDYYATLGVLPTAEDFIIQAAYRALCKRYHPDLNKSDDNNYKMAEINEAYETLGNASKRAIYDIERKKRKWDDSEFFNSDFDNNTEDIDPLMEDWDLAVEYYPDLESLSQRLSKISSRLSFFFRVRLIQDRNFRDAAQMADILELEFLKLYFGTNSKIHDFVRVLVRDGRKEVLNYLNKTIKVLGNNDPEMIIAKISNKYNISTVQGEMLRKKEIEKKKKDEFEKMVISLGGNSDIFSSDYYYSMWTNSNFDREKLKLAIHNANLSEKTEEYISNLKWL